MKMLKAKEQYENRMPARGFQSPVALKARRKIIYPDSDGKPMADNTKQFDWIVKIKENLERIFHDNSDIFIAGDLLWYPEEGNNKIRIAPDAMVVFGRPKGHRGSYRSWEESYIPPQVVFEILSPGNRRAELDGKFQFYQKYEVEEYYIYDPDRIRLNGWIRTGNILIPIANMNGWTSPLLKIRFELASDDLAIYCPDGTRFLSTVELDQVAKSSQKRAEAESLKAESAHQRADAESLKAEAEHQRAEAEHQRAETESRKAEAESQRADAESLKAEAERQRAETESQRAEAESRKAEAERQRAEDESRKSEAEHQRAEAEHQRADAECREKERLAAKLRELGIEI